MRSCHAGWCAARKLSSQTDLGLCGSAVLADEPAEDGCSPDAECGQVADRLVGRLAGLRRALASSLVGPVPVVVGLVLAQDASQVGLVEN